jgi:hypothetical protein
MSDLLAWVATREPYNFLSKDRTKLKDVTFRVDVHISSIASYLPSCENQSAIFGGLSDLNNVTALVSGNSGPKREEERDIQLKDAQLRVVEWEADEDSSGLRRLTSEDDAEGEIDPTSRASQGQDVTMHKSISNGASASNYLNLVAPTQVVESQVRELLLETQESEVDTMDVQRVLEQELAGGSPPRDVEMLSKSSYACYHELTNILDLRKI